jgi:hypothetical protein
MYGMSRNSEVFQSTKSAAYPGLTIPEVKPSKYAELTV